LRVLVITTENPFPPRNGITIPVFNYIKKLSNNYEVDLLIISENPRKEVDYSLVSKCIFLNEFKLGTVFSELTRRKGLFELATDTKFIEKIAKSKYEYILASPISVVSIAKEIATLIEKKYFLSSKVIAAISDSYTAVLRKKKEFGNFKDAIKTIIANFRSLYMGKLESKILCNTYEVLVQSEEDLNWIKRYGNKTLNIRVLTNGVDRSLLCVKPDFNKKQLSVLFVATMSSNYYQSKLLWFYNNVWKKLPNNNFSLVIRGKGLPINDQRFHELLNDNSVVYNDLFADSISDIYKEGEILVAPIFKSYGFINKVGEALAAGLIVVGDKSAFNAINNVKHNVNCLVSTNAKEFIVTLSLINQNINSFIHLSENAKKLAGKQLMWENKLIINGQKN